MNKVKITVCGKEFSLATDETPSYYLGLAKKLDTEINKMFNAGDNISVQSAAILVGLSAFDEIQKLNDSIDNIRTQVKEYVDDACKARSERDEANNTVKSLEEKVTALENELNQLKGKKANNADKSRFHK